MSSYQKMKGGKEDIVRCNGINMDTLKSDGFPQLAFENEVVVEKLFESIEKDLDLHTSNKINIISYS